jgi:putative dCMP deaminase
MSNTRLPFPFYYLGIAESVSKRSTCLSKQYGAVIVKNNAVVSTGYNGAPVGRVNCCERGTCYRIEHHIPRGTNYDLCRSVHAEQNAIINASPDEMRGATMYLYGYDLINNRVVKNASCCTLCRRMIINSGISEVVFADLEYGIPCDGVPYRCKTVNVREWVTNDESLNPNVGY